jgi:hypothetical protein
VNIVETIDVPQMWPLPMGDDALALYRAYMGRVAALPITLKETTLVIGQRGGKSRSLALIATGQDYA